MRIEDEHLDVLQNIESAIAVLYRQFPEMADYEVLRTYEALIDLYVGERIGRPPRGWDPSELEERMFEAVRGTCEWRRGRKPLPGSDSEALMPPADAIPVETLLLALKRLVKSVQKWTRDAGRQGYLDFMSRFVR